MIIINNSQNQSYTPVRRTILRQIVVDSRVNTVPFYNVDFN